ncbi:sterol desaturase family protein [Leptospira yasudae]|uniref:sterol desaturase family protein n=1 Tax=Leptospira yasudae TaxID=2202201 RepID=UPI001C4FCCF4|nr:sterol desaturase family protein [Leptospira yasudae]MBW0433011.1 sterol desaturase family protein [Leptospira yasudae]
MEKNLIELITPVFFVLLVVELIAGYAVKKPVYRFKDSVSNLTAGIYMQVFTVFITVGLVAIYAWVYKNFGIFRISDTSVWGWIACYVLADFCYYWYHRLGHEVNILWASHVAHHQSEDYNYTAALRQGIFQNIFSLPFYLPLAIIGFSPLMFVLCIQINFAYQFWIHTRLIGKLGIIEYILNTPSQHRVHHARNPKYIDKNYAGTFAIWDRMLGTYIEEEDEPIYGIVKPLQTWSPVHAQIHHFEDLARMAWKTKNWKDKFLVWFKPPGWQPSDLGEFLTPPEIDKKTYKKFNTEIPATLMTYSAVQFAFGIGASMIYIEFKKELPLMEMLILGFYILWTFWNISAIFETKTSGLISEIIRMSSIAAISFLFPMDFTGVEKLKLFLSNEWLLALPRILQIGSIVSLAIFGGFLISQKRFFSIRGQKPQTQSTF